MLNVLNVVGPPSCPTGYVVKVGHMPGVTAPQACADELTDCPVHKQNGGCLDANSHHVNWRRLCTKTCGYCDIPFYTRGRKGGNALAGGSTANVVSAEACGKLCTDHPKCHSFEYSPKRATCNRNTLADPTLNENDEDYVFCSRQPTVSYHYYEACKPCPDGTYTQQTGATGKELCKRPNVVTLRSTNRLFYWFNSAVKLESTCLRTSIAPLDSSRTMGNAALRVDALSPMCSGVFNDASTYVIGLHNTLQPRPPARVVFCPPPGFCAQLHPTATDAKLL